MIGPVVSALQPLATRRVTSIRRESVRLLVTGLLLLPVLLHSTAAWAALGGDIASVRGDQGRMNGALRVSVAPSFHVHEILLADGSSIREFASPGGIIFAVAWRTRLKPNLEELLGAYNADYVIAAGDAMKRPGIRRSAVLTRGDLVVHSFGHLNAFAGKAYVPSLVPPGFDINDLR
ncbi:MAG: DUF2844 domain-containing protein [Burkholderiales bacterium]